MKNSLKYWTVFLLFFIIIFSSLFYTNNIQPNFVILTEPPTKFAAQITSLGDPIFLHKIYALKIQNFGDNYGRYSSLKDYDYNLLYKWMKLEDNLDEKSEIIPFTASHYYSQTQNILDNYYMIAYLTENFYLNPTKKWWWLYQAISICHYKIKNYNLALHLSYILASIPANLPNWAREMPAFISEKLGDKEIARIIMKNLLENSENYSNEELNFIYYYINQRVK